MEGSLGEWLLSFVQKPKAADPKAEAKQYLQVYCIEPIQDFTGTTNIPHVANTRPSKGSRKCGIASAFGCCRGTMNVACIEERAVNRRWEAQLLISYCKDIGGHWLLELQNAELSWCHTYGYCAIVWNFYDLDNHLDSKEFQYLMTSMVGELDAPVRTLPTAATPSHVVTCLSSQGAPRNPRNPIPLLTLVPMALPFLACLILVTWAYETYQ
ncbi:hypothetical protein EDC04DRAFT_3089113 [Pisolithus marmoratus]|nr:hypothetical protein EDC04DRAFT_3089113 [Pisolithus marmoratus]